MANKLQSPTESFASTLKAPSIPNEYQAFSGVLPSNVTTPAEVPSNIDDFAQFKKAPLPADTKLYQNLDVRTWVGWYGEGHTVNQIRRWLNEKAFRPELLSELYWAKSDEKQLVDSNFETRKAKEEDFSLFKNTSWLNLESTLGDIRLSRMKAANDVNDFLSNPNSTVRKAFEKNLGSEKLDEYNASIGKYRYTKEWIKAWGKILEEVNLERGIRWIRQMGIINAALDYTWSDYSAYLAAIEDAQKEGATWVINDWTTPTANLLWTWLMYWLWGAWVSKLLTTWLMEAWLALQWARAWATWFSEIWTVLNSPVLGAATNMQKFGSSLSKVWLKIDMMETSAPTLFAATVDNAFTTAIDYGAQISMGKKISYSDFTNDIIIGAATPVVLKWALSWIWKWLEFTKSWARWVTPRDISNLEKAIQNDMKVNWSTDAQSAMVNLEDSFKFSDNKTLWEKIAEYKAAAKNNPDAEVTYEQVMAEMAAKWVSISKGWAKRVAKSINQLNGKLKWDIEWARIGEMSADDNIQMTKKSVMQKLTQEQIVDSNKADDILSTTHKENWVEYKSTKVDEADKLDDLMHNPEFSPTKLDNANTIDEVAKAVDWKATKTTRAEIKEARENIDNNQNKWPEDVKVLAEKEWVPFSDDSAFDKVWLTNKEYLHKVLDDIEYSVIWFTKYATKVRKNFNERVKSEAKNLKTFWRYVKKLWMNPIELWNEWASALKWLMDELTQVTEKLKVVTNASEKNAIEAAIAKKNAEIEKLKISLGNKAKRELAIKQKEISRKNTLIAKIKEDNKLSIAQKNEKIAEIRQSNVDKNTARRSLIAFGKSEIDIWWNLPEYRWLSKQKITSIKNEFKARILNKSTNKELEKIIVDFHKKMYNEAYNTVDKQIDKTIKKIKSEKGWAWVDVQYRNKMIEVYNEFNSAMDESDLVKMNEVLESLKSFAKEWRDVHKETLDIRKQTNQLIAEKALKELEISWKDKYEARLLNTEEGNQWDTSWFQKLKWWVESNIQSQTQMTRMFEWRYEVINWVKKWVENPLNKVFNIAFQRWASKVKLIESQLMDKWIPKLSSSIQKWLGWWDIKSNMTLYHLWKVRNRWYGEYNMRDLIFLRKDSNWNWEYVPTMTPSRLRKQYAKEISDGSVIDFYNSPKDIKQAALDSIYKRFDDMYANKGSEFHIADNEWRAHAVANWLHLKNIMENEFNQTWIPDGDNYWPIIHSNKAWGSEIINDVGWIEASYRRSINDSFTKEMEWATWELNIYHDPVSIVSNHINWNIYYGQMITPLRRAQSLLNLLRKWKNAINSRNIDILMKNITSETKVDSDEMFSMNLLFKNEWASSDSLLTPELDRFLNDNMLKIASNWTSLKASVDMNASRALESVYQNLYHVALSGIGTPLKQPLSLLTALTEWGSANMGSALRSWTMDNISILFDNSWTLYERMPPIVNKEWVWKSMRNTSHESWFNRRWDDVNNIMNNTVGNAIKTMDGGVSLQTFLVWVSKYLDEVYPELHTAWRELNLSKVKEALTPEQFDDMLWYSENFMDRVMSSQNKINASLGSKNPINKIVFFLWKTWLNDTTLFLENVHRLFQSKYWSEQKARLAVALLVTSYIGYNWNKNVVDVVKNKFDETVWAKTAEKIWDSFYSWSGKHIPKDKVTEWDRFAAWLVYFMSNKFIKPSTDFDIARTFNWVIDYWTKINSYPTTARKIEEWFYAATTMFIHRNIPDAGRFLVTKWAQFLWSDMDITKVGNASYDKEVNAIYSSILKDRDEEDGGNKPSMMEQFRWTTEQGYTIPTWSDLKPLIEEQSSITKAEDLARKQAKEIAKNKEAIEIWFKKSGWNTNDYNSFFSYALSNKDMLNAAGIKNTELVTWIQELYKKISGKDVSDKTTINLLKWKPLNIIFDVKIKPLLEAWSPKQVIDAEVGNLYQNKMFKSANWVQQMNQLITDYLIKR